MKKILSIILCLGALLTLNTSAKAQEIQDAQYYFNLGADYEWKNNKLGAIGIYSKALDIDENFDAARIARAKLLYFNGRYQEALQDFNYFYNKTPQYGPTAFYQFRINTKLQLGMCEEALDDMYEVILAYAGQSQVLDQMIQIIQARPELKYKLTTNAHPELITKYKSNAQLIRNYAELYIDSDKGMKNPPYFRFYMDIAKAMYAQLTPSDVFNTSNIRKTESEGQEIDVEEEVIDEEK